MSICLCVDGGFISPDLQSLLTINKYDKTVPANAFYEDNKLNITYNVDIGAIDFIDDRQMLVTHTHIILTISNSCP